MKAYCNTCKSEVAFLRISPHAHDDQRSCGECWEFWLSRSVEENRTDEIRCMFCPEMLDFDQITKLARQATMSRYAEKSKDNSVIGLICMDRCTKKKQPFDREKDGRVFTCSDCGYQTCADCDKPEHKDETCSDYKDRLSARHAGDEQASQRALEAYKTCPDCRVPFTKDKCGFTQCSLCAYRFCSGCMIPWVGNRSAYSDGKKAHLEGCVYRTRDKESKHGLKRRFQEFEEQT